jgi:hypothetical protein
MAGVGEYARAGSSKADLGWADGGGAKLSADDWADEWSSGS